MICKKIFIGAAALGVSSFALAQGDIGYQAPPVPFAPSVYIGAKVGYSITNWKSVDASWGVASISNYSGFAAGAYAGWWFAKHFAIEAGWNPDLYTVKIRRSSNKKLYKADNQGSAELMAKMIVPFPGVEGVSVYTRLGGAYRYTNKSLAGTHENVFNVAYGAGVVWAFAQSFGLDAGWTQYNGNSKWSKKYFPTTNRFMLGFYYDFPLS